MSTAPLSFGLADAQVEDLVDRGTAFPRVEDAIDAARLASDHKAALWLLAWSLRDPAVQRRDARLMARSFGPEGLSGRRLRAVPDVSSSKEGA